MDLNLERGLRHHDRADDELSVIFRSIGSVAGGMDIFG